MPAALRSGVLGQSGRRVSPAVARAVRSRVAPAPSRAPLRQYYALQVDRIKISWPQTKLREIWYQAVLCRQFSFIHP